jgi:hypothetical protein
MSGEDDPFLELDEGTVKVEILTGDYTYSYCAIRNKYNTYDKTYISKTF